MKNITKRQTRTIIQNIKENYYNCKDALRPEPSPARNISFAMALNAILLLILEIIYLATRKDILIIVFCILFLLLLILSGFRYYYDRKLKQFYEATKEDIRTLCEMAIEDEAKKYDVSKEQLSLYLMKYHKVPWLLRLICNIISITFTAFAVYFLPGYNQVNHHILVFLILLFANVMISTFASYMIKLYEQLDDFEFLIIQPYDSVFKKIDKKSK